MDATHPGVKLPVTVLDVTYQSVGLWAVRLAYADGTTGTFLIPRNLVTAEAVTVGALAMATVLDVNVNQVGMRNPLTGTYTVGAP